MNYLVYGGCKYTQVRHAIYCKKCRDTIESKVNHDYKYCMCGAVGIDGGCLRGNRYIGRADDMETRSMYIAMINKKRLWLPQEIIELHFKKISQSKTNKQ